MRTRPTILSLLLRKLSCSAPPSRTVSESQRLEAWIAEEQWLAGLPAPWREYSGWCNLRDP